MADRSATPRGLLLALSVFTITPVRAGSGRPVVPDRRSARAVIMLAPVVGLALGLVGCGVLLGARILVHSPLPPLLPAALTVASLALLTRGLHLDGLADTADGLGSMLPADQARAVMREPQVGAFAVVTLVLVLLVQVSALTSAVLFGRGSETVVLGVVVGRLAVVAACTGGTPAADTTGLGAWVAGSVPRFATTAMVVVVGLLAAGVASYDEGSGWIGAGRCVLALALGLLTARALRRLAVRRLGGLTGDVLGALVEVAATVVFVVMAFDAPAPVKDWLGDTT